MTRHSTGAEEIRTQRAKIKEAGHQHNSTASQLCVNLALIFLVYKIECFCWILLTVTFNCNRNSSQTGQPSPPPAKTKDDWEQDLLTLKFLLLYVLNVFRCPSSSPGTAWQNPENDTAPITYLSTNSNCGQGHVANLWVGEPCVTPLPVSAGQPWKWKRGITPSKSHGMVFLRKRDFLTKKRGREAEHIKTGYVHWIME